MLDRLICFLAFCRSAPFWDRPMFTSIVWQDDKPVTWLTRNERGVCCIPIPEWAKEVLS